MRDVCEDTDLCTAEHEAGSTNASLKHEVGVRGQWRRLEAIVFGLQMVRRRDRPFFERATLSLYTLAVMLRLLNML